MPAGVDMTWRGVRPLLPGVASRLSGPATAAAASTTTATIRTATKSSIRNRLLLARENQWARPSLAPAPCVLCRPRRTTPTPGTPLFIRYSSTAAGSDKSGSSSSRDESTSNMNTTSSTATTTDDSLSPSVISWQAIAKEGEDKRRRDIEDELRRRQQNQSAVAAATSTTATPGTILIESLDRTPMVTPDGAPTASAAASSALTKPLIYRVASGENERIRKQHVKSVVRQGRLEIMRQMQDLHMVDWRQVLRRLAMSTPRGESYEQVNVAAGVAPAEAASEAPSPANIVGWRKNAVLFAFPDNSPSVTELVHGVDDSMWAIWSRTACVLKLYRWQGARSSSSSSLSDFSSRPWLLSLSGPGETALSHAVLDVVRFAKDAEPVSLSGADLALLDDAWTRAKTGRSAEISAATIESAAAAAAEATAAEPETKQTGPWKLMSSSYFYDSRYRDDPVFQPHVTDIVAHDVPRPDAWTPDSFERYVAALVNGKPPPQLGTKMYHEQLALGHDNDQPLPLPPRNAANRQQPVAPSHSLAVIHLLHSAFHDERARASVTLSAFKMALAYMCRFGEAHRPDVRALFTRVEELQIPMDTETFNIILASHAESQDVRNFGTTLRLMRSRRHGYTPNLTTWLLFLRLFGSEEVKRHVLHTMFARGLLHTTRAVRLVALEMAEHDAQLAVVGGSSSPSSSFMRDFMANQAQRYGPHWLSRAAANRLLDVFASHGLFAECDELLAALQEKQDAETRRPRRPKSKMAQARARVRQQQQEAEAVQRGGGGSRTSAAPPPTPPPMPPGFVVRLSLDTFTYNVVLTHCKVQNNLAAALLILRRMEVAGAPKVPDGLTSHVVGRPWLPRIPPDSATYHLLFSLAWKRRLPHAMAVVWHYACLALQARHWLLLRVSRERVALADGQQVPLAHYLTGVYSEEEDEEDQKNKAPRPPRSVSGYRPVHQAGLDMSTRLEARYHGWEPAEPLSKVLQDAIDRDAAMREATASASSASSASSPPPPPPMRILLRKKGRAEDEVVTTGQKTTTYLEIPVPWGEFKPIQYSRAAA